MNFITRQDKQNTWYITKGNVHTINLATLFQNLFYSLPSQHPKCKCVRIYVLLCQIVKQTASEYITKYFILHASGQSRTWLFTVELWPYIKKTASRKSYSSNRHVTVPNKQSEFQSFNNIKEFSIWYWIYNTKMCRMVCYCITFKRDMCTLPMYSL